MSGLLCPVLVGRDQDAGALRDGLRAALDGEGRVVALLGEAGIGKSRLARELVEEARKQCTVLTGRALPGATSTGLRAFADALQPAFRSRRPPNAEELRPFVAALARLVPEWRTEPAAPPSDPVITGEGLLRLLKVLAGPTASVLVLEDLHWADADTLAVLEYVVDHVATEPVLCILTCRSDEPSSGSQAVQALIDRRAVQPITLSRLDEANAMDVARACLHTADVPSGLLDLVSRADGVPFLIEELLASAVAVGALVHDADAWRFDRVGPRVVPTTFFDSIHQRVGGLSANARTVLRAGALFGRSFDWTLLGLTTQLADEEVVAAVRSAQDRQLVELDRTRAESAFRFRHALTRDAIDAELLPHERAALAARALDATQMLRPGLPGEWCSTAIGLAETAGLHERAAELLMELAARAVAEGALSTAEALLEKARAQVDATPLRARVDLDCALLDVLVQAGKTDRAVVLAECLLDRLEAPGGSDHQRAAVHLDVARACAAGARWQDASQHVDMARRLSPPGETRSTAAIQALLAEIAMGQQDPVQARTHAESALDIAQANGLADIACHALEVLGRATRVHDLDAAERYFVATVQLAERHRLVVRRVRALHELGTIGMLRAHELQYLEQANELALEAGALSTAAIVNLQIGAVYVYGLEHEAALKCAQRSADLAAHLGLGQTLAAATAMQATAHALAGRRERLAATAAEAVALGRGHPDIYGQVYGNAYGLAGLLWEQPGAALSALDEAMNSLRDPRCTVPGGIIGPLWALLHTIVDRDATARRDEVRSSRAAHIPIARAVLGYADAVALGRAGKRAEAMAGFDRADALFGGYQHLGVRPLGLRLVAEAAFTDGWGQPVPWLREALAFFDENQYPAVAAACRRLLARAGVPLPRRGRGSSTVPHPLRARGVTSREVDVLALVMQGLSNKQIGERLYLSPKTVEKHLEHLMAKLELGSRGELAAAGQSAGVTAACAHPENTGQPATKYG